MTGIYLLKKNDEVVYIGQSIDIDRRVTEHKYRKEKDFDTHSYIKCSVDLLDNTEYAYIAKYSPKYNVIGVTSGLIHTLGEDQYKPRCKNIWFTSVQLEQLAYIQEITGLTIADTVRIAMDEMYLKLKEETE